MLCAKYVTFVLISFRNSDDEMMLMMTMMMTTMIMMMLLLLMMMVMMTMWSAIHCKGVNGHQASRTASHVSCG